VTARKLGSMVPSDSRLEAGPKCKNVLSAFMNPMADDVPIGERSQNSRSTFVWSVIFFGSLIFRNSFISADSAAIGFIKALKTFLHFGPSLETAIGRHH